MSLNKVLAALLVVIFVIFGFVVVVTWSVERNILDVEAYISALDEAEFFEVPYQLIREGEIPTPGGLLLKEGPLSVVSDLDMEAIARELAPPAWLRDQLERAIRDLLAVPEKSELDELPDLVISLSEVKERVLGEPGDRALSIVVQSLPVCASGRVPLDLNSDTPVCKPTQADLNPFLDQLKMLMTPLVQRVPDTYRVSWQPEQQDVLDDLQQAAQTLNRLRFALLLVAALDVALLCLVWVLAVRSPAEWLRWAGVPFLLLGLLVLLAALLIPRGLIWSLDIPALSAERNVPASLVESLDKAAGGFVPLLFRPARFLGVALTIVGLLLTLISPLFPGTRQRLWVASTPGNPGAGGYGRLR
jgi:hypothetical protein